MSLTPRHLLPHPIHGFSHGAASPVRFGAAVPPRVVDAEVSEDGTPEIKTGQPGIVAQIFGVLRWVLMAMLYGGFTTVRAESLDLGSSQMGTLPRVP